MQARRKERTCKDCSQTFPDYATMLVHKRKAHGFIARGKWSSPLPTGNVGVTDADQLKLIRTKLLEVFVLLERR